MFMNTDSSYKNLFRYFCLIFTIVFQIFWVPEVTIPQNFFVGEPWQRGISSAWCDTQNHSTPVLSGTCEFQQPRVEAAWCLSCSLTLTLKNPRAAHVAQLPWHKLWAAPCPSVPGFPVAKRDFRLVTNCSKNFDSCCWRAECSVSELKGSCSASFCLHSVLENN